MNTLFALAITPPLAFLLWIYVQIPDKIIAAIDERSERREKRKELDRRVKAWERIALEKSAITEPIARGYAVANLLNAAYERRCLNGGRKNI